MGDKLTDALRDPPTLVDGEPATHIEVTNRALAYGDGLFETIALHDGVPQHWARHLQRLAAGATKIFMTCPPATRWLADIARLHALSGSPARAVLKLLLIRGAGGRGYAPDPKTPPLRMAQLFEWPASRGGNAPFTAIECATPLGLNPLLAGLKHLNRLEQVLGAREVAEAGADEGVMFDVTHAPIAGTRSNFFVVKDGALSTPLLTSAGIAGVMRAIIIEHVAAAQRRVHERPLTRADLLGCDELFFTNSLRGVQSVQRLRLAGTERALQDAYAKNLRRELAQARHLP